MSNASEAIPETKETAVEDQVMEEICLSCRRVLRFCKCDPAYEPDYDDDDVLECDCCALYNSM